jgi:uncharacterized protein YqgV (UPF0045/DUF77 family)
MKIQAEISIYPLKTKSLSEPINEFCQILENKGLKVETRTMSSFVVEESEAVFKSVQKAFEKLAEKYDLVMDIKVSNACPNNTERMNFKKE